MYQARDSSCSRTIKKDAKAGNINNALQFATGELCVVLDPDHIPSPDFLDHVAGWFDDASIGFVQIVQAYYNQEESLVAKGAAQQTYQFYGPMMMAMHTYGTVQAIGANCTFRRSALDSIGGHASGLSEDMHTAMHLHAKGWRSIYVPAILTRGLVPATMSSYYKQQLKWSRGTWELLVTTYPRLFNKFTWRQKIHYFTLPFHYLCGFIFLINFLIPVISLFTGYIPLQMDVVNFLLAAIPLFTMSILIRYYVQKWVAEEKERGFHLVGGILQIGTWWIFCIGFIYTVFRKKVPYIPTPKNDNDPLPFLLTLPNLLVALISLIAIVYGLLHDYNPYTIFMALLAAMQILFMVFNLSISGYIKKTSRINNIAMKLRSNTWLIVKAHSFLRKYSLILSCILIAVFILAYRQQQQLPKFLPKPLPGLQVFYRGLYQQTNINDSGINNAAKKNDIAIISTDIVWGQGEKNRLDTNLLKHIYNLKAIPLLALSLWQNDSAFALAKDKNVLQHIVEGKYDKWILPFAAQLSELKKPVFLRFNEEPVQEKYPLFGPVKYNPEDFIAAWQYIHRLFDSVGADRVIWVWNPRSIDSVDNFFPGNSYVDWLGVNAAVIKTTGKKNNAVSFDSIYRPYHLSALFQSGLPVMITQTISHPQGIDPWWNAAWNSIDTAFTEIKSVIADGSNINNKQINAAIKSDVTNAIFTNAPDGSSLPDMQQTDGYKKFTENTRYLLPASIKSVVYDKGFYWFRNRHTMNLNTVEKDVSDMKKMGINTIERNMPGFYDDNLGKILLKNNMNLIPHFWLLASPEIIADDNQMQQQKEAILKVVKENIDKKYIIAWNLGDDVLHSLANQTFKPEYFYYQQKYVAWLDDICRSIRAIDNKRPLVMDLYWDAKGIGRFNYYKAHVPLLNTYMLQADSKYKAGLKETLKDGMAWGKVEVALWPLVPSIAQSGTIPCWQDIENTKYITLNGLLDMEGRKKEWYNIVANNWGKVPLKRSLIPDIRILRPAKLTHQNGRLLYHVVYRKADGQWKIYKDEIPGLHFEWNMIRVDQYGNTMFIKKAGQGPVIEFPIPDEPQYYQLSVEAILDTEVKMVTATLNTPLN